MPSRITNGIILSGWWKMIGRDTLRATVDNNSALNQVFIKRDEHGRLLPGGAMLNPAGRPPNPVSLVKRLKDRLAASPKEQDDIINSLLGLSKSEMPAVQLLFDRIDGKVASHVNFQGVMVHIGDDYARLGLTSNTKELSNYEQLYLTDGNNGDNSDGSIESECK